MLDSTLFDVLDAIGRGVRAQPPPPQQQQPFGGLQVLLVGDFYQLPPVGLGRFGKRFAFQSIAWTALFGDGGGCARTPLPMASSTSNKVESSIDTSSITSTRAARTKLQRVRPSQSASASATLAALAVSGICEGPVRVKPSMQQLGDGHHRSR